MGRLSERLLATVSLNKIASWVTIPQSLKLALVMFLMSPRQFLQPFRYIIKAVEQLGQGRFSTSRLAH